MIELSLQEIAAACAGVVENAVPSDVVTNVVTDSRRVGPGTLFVALQGERRDGHAFVPHAIEQGAVAALVADTYDGAEPVVRVPDPLAALAALARAVRLRLRARVVAVTGSAGKTITKEFAAAAIGTTFEVLASEASFNNEIGVPLTLLGASQETEVIVAEIGSRGPGHIAALVPVLRPDVAIVTNVGTAHLGMFGSLEVTARAKAELVEGLGRDGVAVLNADDPAVRAMAGATKARTVTFGRTGADVRAENLVLDEDARAAFTVVAGDEKAEISLRVPGEHMVSNALAAVAAARALGVPVATAARGVRECGGAAWRMEVHEIGGRRILNDAYNANPDSTAAALKTLVAMGGARPTWAVLGEMAELGDASNEHHDRIGRLAVRLGVAHLVTVGEAARAIHEAARLEGMFGGEATFVADAGEAVRLLRDRMEPDAIVLVKASRAAGLERVALELAR